MCTLRDRQGNQSVTSRRAGQRTVSDMPATDPEGLTLTVAEYEHRIKSLVLLNRPFTEIEDVIDAAALTEEEKAALWLVAWSHLGVRAQRRMAHATLAAVSRFPSSRRAGRDGQDPGR
jgi:hypothetical protein